MHAANRSQILVAAIGSDHGDDRAAWDAARAMCDRLPPGVRVIACREPLELLEIADPGSALVVADSCRGAGSPGSVHRFEWPDPRLVRVGAASSHGFGVAAALELAAKLGRLPPRVVVLAVEGESAAPGEALSPAVAAGIPALAEALLAEVRSLTSSPDDNGSRT